jgi:hypothetical protein
MIKGKESTLGEAALKGHALIKQFKGVIYE